MNRRNFLTRSGLALGALVVGAEALDAMERLTHVRKSFPSAGVPWTMRYARVEYEMAPMSMERYLATLQASDDGNTWRILQVRPVDADGSVHFAPHLLSHPPITWIPEHLP